MVYGVSNPVRFNRVGEVIGLEPWSMSLFGTSILKCRYVKPSKSFSEKFSVLVTSFFFFMW